MTMKFWKRPEEETHEERIMKAVRVLVGELHDRELRLITDKHMVNACKEQLRYLQAQVSQ